MSFFGEVASLPVRTYDEEQAFLEQVAPCQWQIKPGFVPGMRVPGTFYVNPALQSLLFGELEQYCRASARQAFRSAAEHQH